MFVASHIAVAEWRGASIASALSKTRHRIEIPHPTSDSEKVISMLGNMRPALP
jgi:hypothetical protein